MIHSPDCHFLKKDLQTLCQEPNHDQTRTDDLVVNGHMLYLIDVLKELPAEEFPERFPNRWEEIRTLTLAALELNRDKHY